MAKFPPPWEVIPRFDIGDWWKDESLPISFDKYSDPGKVSVEVGFGHGEFIHQMAKADPGSIFIGIEHFGEGFRKLVRDLKKDETTNCFPLIGDGFIILQAAFADGSLSDIYVNFPDPWPKKRHENRRLFVEEFFSLASRKLGEGGVLHLATDHRPLSDQALKELGKVKSLVSIDGQPFKRESPYPFRTRYERKWITEQRELFYFTYERIRCLT